MDQRGTSTSPTTATPVCARSPLGRDDHNDPGTGGFDMSGTAPPRRRKWCRTTSQSTERATSTSRRAEQPRTQGAAVTFGERRTRKCLVGAIAILALTFTSLGLSAGLQSTVGAGPTVASHIVSAASGQCSKAEAIDAVRQLGLSDVSADYPVWRCCVALSPVREARRWSLLSPVLTMWACCTGRSSVGLGPTGSS